MKSSKTPKARRNPGELLVTFVLDETGSMVSCMGATISSVNEYLDGLQANKDTKEAKVTLTSFNSEGIKKRAAAEALSKVQRLSTENYVPAASTPLYDAIGQAIRETEAAIKASGKKPGKVLFVVQTDGYENASKEYTQVQVKQMIDAHKDEWTFVFLGANMDAWAMAEKIGGLAFAQNAKSYAGTPIGTSSVMGAVLRCSTRYAASTGGPVTQDFFAGEEDKD